ncbi:MAG TPA: hypothetical protein PK881_08260 [Leptospiraceae bacterium]|nr:hypothetical protein [Leptospiraceae bacterium]
MNDSNAVTRIASRYSGPPRTGNGGYVCGVCAGLAYSQLGEQKQDSFTFEVRYKSPVPVDLDVSLLSKDNLCVLESIDGKTTYAEGQSSKPVSTVLPAVVTLEQARYATLQSIPEKEHAFPDCYVCGPARKVGDGLRILPGPVAEHSGMAAAVWNVLPDAMSSSGDLSVPILWAALDCPGYFAYHFSHGGAMQVAVLAKMKCTVVRRRTESDQLVVIGWMKRKKGPLVEVSTALLDGSEILAIADGTWMQPASWNPENTGHKSPQYS